MVGWRKGVAAACGYSQDCQTPALSTRALMSDRRHDKRPKHLISDDLTNMKAIAKAEVNK